MINEKSTDLKRLQEVKEMKREEYNEAAETLKELNNDYILLLREAYYSKQQLRGLEYDKEGKQ